MKICSSDMKRSALIMLMLNSFCAFSYEAPVSALYPAEEVQLGVENTLTCFVNHFYPPDIKVSWTKNGQPLSEGVSLSRYYPNNDQTFHQFSTLTFTPTEEDIYSCTVEHSALDRPITRIWEPEFSQPSLTPDIVFGVGMAVALLGIAVGLLYSPVGTFESSGIATALWRASQRDPSLAASDTAQEIHTAHQPRAPRDWADLMEEVEPIPLLFEDVFRREGDDDADGETGSDILELDDMEEGEEDSTFPTQSRPPSSTEAAAPVDNNRYKVCKRAAAKLNIPWPAAQDMEGATRDLYDGKRLPPTRPPAKQLLPKKTASFQAYGAIMGLGGCVRRSLTTPI
ncbi:RLA class II histocompatibility antigen, DP alpha-1 chain D10 haplotype [Larimichthys crocea]|uniref:RLA class II histocompatibility antigen, DP alpha-1 chain D10 haplotype n=1 Tax=Larimichthys crocea TaxID=215358 RepID=A0A6G0IBI3_LARCR|nr:RLA class II histocompatibility antigen, DP alpha-1 chain D10 haplotype [Larimichthys crocea]